MAGGSGQLRKALALFEGGKLKGWTEYVDSARSMKFITETGALEDSSAK
jgi:hypothetical protein